MGRERLGLKCGGCGTNKSSARVRSVVIDGKKKRGNRCRDCAKNLPPAKGAF